MGATSVFPAYQATLNRWASGGKAMHRSHHRPIDELMPFQPAPACGRTHNRYWQGSLYFVRYEP
jgi:hypothetical protein